MSFSSFLAYNKSKKTSPPGAFQSEILELGSHNNLAQHDMCQILFFKNHSTQECITLSTLIILQYYTMILHRSRIIVDAGSGGSLVAPQTSDGEVSGLFSVFCFCVFFLLYSRQGLEFAHQFSERIGRFLRKNEQMSDSLKKICDSLILSFLVNALSDSLLVTHLC